MPGQNGGISDFRALRTFYPEFSQGIQFTQLGCIFSARPPDHSTCLTQNCHSGFPAGEDRNLPDSGTCQIKMRFRHCASLGRNDRSRYLSRGRFAELTGRKTQAGSHTKIPFLSLAELGSAQSFSVFGFFLTNALVCQGDRHTARALPHTCHCRPLPAGMRNPAQPARYEKEPGLSQRAENRG